MISYLQIENISKRYGETVLFENISFGIGKGSKLALIAPNGTGKTSLLNIIGGKDTPDTGTVIFRNNITIGYLEQSPEVNDDNTVMDEVFTADSEEINVIRQYENMMGKGETEGLEEVLEKMDHLKAWDYEAKIKQILSILKIPDFNQRIKELSGGQKKRVGLAKVLLREPDFLIMDEPTNHLDLEMIEWLEDYLFKTKSTLLMVTHDRYFLDRVCDEIIEIDNNTVYSYKGNYSYYLEKREERIANKTAEITRAQNLLRKEAEWMRRMPKARSHKAKYRIDAFHKTKEAASQKIIDNKLDIDIKGSRLGKKILEIDKISKSFGELNLIKNFSYKFTRGEKIGIIGKNGAGKSTFLNIITGNLPQDSGNIETGETVIYGYYKQEDYDIDTGKRAIDVIKDVAETVTLGSGKVLSASKFLEFFLFNDKQQYSYVENLSGGERRRLYLMTVLMKSPNFLILDEPTNDLDIMTLNVLEEYLKLFSGCVLIVSHDRYFMDKIVDHLFVFEGNGVIKDFHSNYSIYRDYKLEQEENKKSKLTEKKENETIKIKNTAAKEKPKKLSYNEKKEFEQLEVEIEKLTEEKSSIEELLNSGTLSPNELIDKSNRIGQIIDLLDEKELRWLELSEMI